jgi:predicted DCC family thiol-disulfide oxidoreductase YuxK
MFILNRDRHARFIFAASQSSEGQKLLGERDIKKLAAHSIILLYEGRIYEKSTAALNIVRGLRGLWPLLYCCIVIPRKLRDILYDSISKNRYTLFGIRDSCFVPSEEIKNRFISPQPPQVP